MTKQEQLRYEYFIETGTLWIDTNDNIEMDYLKWVENKALTIPVVSDIGSENNKTPECKPGTHKWDYHKRYMQKSCKVCDVHYLA